MRTWKLEKAFFVWFSFTRYRKITEASQKPDLYFYRYLSSKILIEMHVASHIQPWSQVKITYSFYWIWGEINFLSTRINGCLLCFATLSLNI
jgi:hypothetical protein